jgi:hypothetical protein
MSEKQPTQQERDEAVEKSALEAAAAGESPPKHLALDYSGPLTGDQARERHLLHGENLFRQPVTKPADVKATK